jgi:hypothetical protein
VPRWFCFEKTEKFGDWRRSFTAAKKDSGFGTRVGRGETGLPADTDEAADRESARRKKKGVKRFKYFRECHAIFGACASVDTSLAQESLSPLQQLAAEGDTAASPGKPVRQAMLSALKRLRADKSESSSELTPLRQYVHDRELCIIGSPISRSGSPLARQRAQPSTSAPKQRRSKVQIAAEALTEAKAGSALSAARTKADAVKELAAVSAQAQTDAGNILAKAEKERQDERFDHEAKQHEVKLGAQRDSERRTQVLQLAKELRDGGMSLGAAMAEAKKAVDDLYK